MRQLNYVNFTTRAFSGFFDMLIIILLYCIPSSRLLSKGLPFFLDKFLFIVFFIIYQFFFLNSRWQATLGKIVFDVKLVDIYGNKPTKKQILCRSILALCFFLPLSKIFAYIFYSGILPVGTFNFNYTSVLILYALLHIIVFPLNIFSMYFLSKFLDKKRMLYDILSKTYVVYDGSTHPSFIQEDILQPVSTSDKK